MFWLPFIESLCQSVNSLTMTNKQNREVIENLEKIKKEYEQINKLSELQQAIKLLEKNGFNMELRFKK